MSHSKASIKSGFYSLLQNCNFGDEKTKNIDPESGQENKIYTQYKNGESVIFESKSFSELHSNSDFEGDSKPLEGNIFEKLLPIIPKVTLFY